MKALITGITGQDGAYLSELLLRKGYEVHGIKRRSSSFNTGRIDHIFNDLHLHYGDLTDAISLVETLQKVKPDEVYNLAAQSHVKVSFDHPDYTQEVNGNGTLRLLKAIHALGLNCKFYQASTSELYGNSPAPQNENTPFSPQSPYAIAKENAFKYTKLYREAYGMFACNGILFNHESPLRGETFVTRKITMAVAGIKKGKQDKLYLGNLDSQRDWGHAKDYVEGMWLMLQQDQPDDYVLATGKTCTVRKFVEMAFREVGIDIEWKGEGVNEKGYSEGKVLVEVDPKYFRPAEVDLLLGDPSKARKVLGWKHKYELEDLVKEMVNADLRSGS